jgi:hypothetical protein
MKALSTFRNMIFPTFSRQHAQILNLQKTIQDLKDQKSDIAVKEKVLRSELQYIYSIIINRNGCRIKLFPLLKQETLLLAVENKPNQVNFYLYTPNFQANEIALVFTEVKENKLIIVEFYSEPDHKTTEINRFLLQQINAEAKALGLSEVDIRSANMPEHLTPVALTTAK